MENWQLCPKCKGDDILNNHSGMRCRIYDGTGLINMMTGRPPSSMMAKATPINSSLTDNVGCSNKELSKIFSNTHKSNQQHKMGFKLKDGDIVDTASLKPYLSPNERSTYKLILFYGKWIKVRKNN